MKQTILPIPDSILTNEQLGLKIKLSDIIFKEMYIEENCQKLSITKEYFERESIPSIYYDIIEYQIAETNECIKRWIAEDSILAPHLLNQDSMLRIAKEQYWNIERPLLIKRLTKE